MRFFLGTDKTAVDMARFLCFMHVHGDRRGVRDMLFEIDGALVLLPTELHLEETHQTLNKSEQK